ncbi:MAG TPA: carboxypeptidase regulatory-like domain-containing protein [Burkholderiales bacterium]|nr:carboxypeptidase regulatory-like domain-containing protein [Burkholderiales bacterium]
MQKAWAAPSFQQQGNVSYVTGGIGLEEREALVTNTSDFNLKVVNAIPGGAYVSDTTVSVVNATGQEVLRTTLDGPWLIAKLPPGKYTISASDLSRTAQARTVQLSERGQREVVLRWTDVPVAAPASTLAPRPAPASSSGL